MAAVIGSAPHNCTLCITCRSLSLLLLAIPARCACVCAVAGVHDGYVLTKSISRSPVGGKLLNICLQKALEARGIQVKPRQTFKRVERKPGEFVVSLGSL